MTTLREKLKEKIKQGSVQSLWEEIQQLFLDLPCSILSKGVTIKIFQNYSESPLYYIIGSGSTGKAFSGGYNLDIFQEVIPILEKDGIKVTKENSTNYRLEFIP